jgi:predicted dehydrogenase
MSSSIDRRDFLAATLASGLVTGASRQVHATFQSSDSTSSPNNVLRVACIGVRGRGRNHIQGLEKLEGVHVVALCDIDENVLKREAARLKQQTGREIKTFVDYREVCDDPAIDVVSIATCNHTHTLIAINAMMAGKDVYVEKPCSHNIWEGRQLVNAARKYNRMCQHGTQGRSSPAIREAIQKLREGVIGEVYMARGLCFKWRPSISHTPDEPVPEGVHYDLWLGPAPNRPFSRNRFHYNWHWHWDYGNGDMGNQGVHEMDMARWGLGVGLPSRVYGAGGHYMFDDDQETPNTLVCSFEYPEENKMLVFETRHWITNHEGFTEGPQNEVGVTFYGSEGFMQVKYFDYQTFLGKQREPGPSGQGNPNPFERFVAGVRSRKHEDLGVEIEEGHLSSALCHLGNISYRLKRSLEFDPQTETFSRDDDANAMLSRDYRKPYVVPKVEI